MTDDSVSQKTCIRCRQTQPQGQFYRDRSKADGLTPYCKSCIAEMRGYTRRTEIPVPDGYRICTKCGTMYPATKEHFYINRMGKYGLFSRCIRCHTGNDRVHNKLMPEGYKQCCSCKKIKLLSAFYKKQRNPDGYQYRCKDCSGKDWKSYKAEHTDELHRKRIDRYWANADPRRAKDVTRRKDWRKSHPEEVQAIKRRSRRMCWHNRKARERNFPSDFTTADWQYALDYFHECCAFCGRQLNDLFGVRAVAVEHWIPLSSQNCPGTIPENIVPACHGKDGCNNHKATKDPETWVFDHFGKRRGRAIIKRIREFFATVRKTE